MAEKQVNSMMKNTAAQSYLEPISGSLRVPERGRSRLYAAALYKGGIVCREQLAATVLGNSPNFYALRINRGRIREKSH